MIKVSSFSLPARMAQVSILVFVFGDANLIKFDTISKGHNTALNPVPKELELP